MIDDIIKTARAQIDNAIYVWGGDGEVVSAMSNPESWIKSHETSAVNGARSVTLYKKLVEAGAASIRAFDCSGLVYWCLKQYGLLSGDLSSRGLYGKCRASTLDALRPGDLVFKATEESGKPVVPSGIYHVGIYTGSTVIECIGRDYGVVERAPDRGSWNVFGQLTLLDAYQDEPVTEEGEYSFVRLLKKGVRGRDVIALKKLLIAAGYNTGITTNTPTSEVFGNATRRCVLDYQLGNGLDPDGIAGPLTILKLGGRWS